jgi:hypothetical protein
MQHTGGVLTAFGVVVLTFMMLMYALERRGPRFVLAFAVGCVLASVYGFLAGTWPFGVVELIWAAIAWRRWSQLAAAASLAAAGSSSSHGRGMKGGTGPG